jgi:hypothetical protein
MQGSTESAVPLLRLCLLDARLRRRLTGMVLIDFVGYAPRGYARGKLKGALPEDQGS